MGDERKPPLIEVSLYYAGNPDLMKVINEKKPNTANVPKPKINPRMFLFFNALRKPNNASIATKAKIIAVPMFYVPLSVAYF